MYADGCPREDNHVYHTSGRSPALSGNTLFHAVNSVWEDNNGHAIEGDSNGQGLFEGCVFKDVATVVANDFTGHLFGASSSDLDSCKSFLGRACEANTLTGSGAFSEDDTGFLSNFTGMTIARATSAADAESNILGNVGCGKFSSSSSTGSSSGLQASSRPQAFAASYPSAPAASVSASSAAANVVGSYGSPAATTVAPSGALPTVSGAVYPVPGGSGSYSGHHNATTGLSPAGVSSQSDSSSEGSSSEQSGSPSVTSSSSSAGSSSDALSSAEGKASTGSDSSYSTSSSAGKSSKCRRNKKLRRSLMSESQLQSVSGLL